MRYTQLEELQKCGIHLTVPSGISMKPMLYEADSIAEIHTITSPPKRCDVVMYIRGDSQSVLHRVLYQKGDIYVINGDNCWQKEYVRAEQIHGIVTRFYRKGHWYEVTEPMYQLYSHVWVDLFFIRRPVLYLRDKMKSLKRRLNGICGL